MDFRSDLVGQVCPAPDPHQRAPRDFTVPPGAVDSHAHVVGTDFVPNRSYTPPPASRQQYLANLDATAMTYGVLVQISVHGTDNAVMLDTVRAHSDRLRAVAVVDPHVADAELHELREANVVGLRLNTVAGGGFGFENLSRYHRICAEMGWHLQFLTNTEHLAEHRHELAKLTVPFVVDHMGDFDVTRGTQASEWQLLLGLMSDGAWAKLSGAFRVSDRHDYTDTIAFAQSLIAAAPERCVWGSDWPHVGYWGAMPNIGDLLDLLGRWAPDVKQRDAILVSNAHRLYGFETETPASV